MSIIFCVPREGIEPPTQGSSDLRSTTELPRRNTYHIKEALFLQRNEFLPLSGKFCFPIPRDVLENFVALP